MTATLERHVADDVGAQAARRRTFAIISHPDAGKSTLTEALALHARVISEAGHIHGKAGRRSTLSDWMEMEKARVAIGLGRRHHGAEARRPADGRHGRW
jgi:peptide chain release factor 3